MASNYSLSYLPIDMVNEPEGFGGIQPWIGESEPMLPARQVMWASLSLFVVALAVLLAV